MVASYKRVRIGMARSEVRAAVAQLRPNREAWSEVDKQHWELASREGTGSLAEQGILWDGWVDDDVSIVVTYRDGKAISKSLSDKGDLS
jgi:hypothetical protein